MGKARGSEFVKALDAVEEKLEDSANNNTVESVLSPPDAAEGVRKRVLIEEFADLCMKFEDSARNNTVESGLAALDAAKGVNGERLRLVDKSYSR